MVTFALLLILSQFQYLPYLLAAIFHEPFGCGGGAADAYAAHFALEPFGADILGIIHLVRGGINLAAGFAEHAAVAAFLSADEDDHIVAGCKGADIRQAVGHLAADGVEVAELGRGLDALADVVHHLAEALQGLGGLAEEADVAAEIQSVRFLGMFNHDGRAVRLAHEAQHLSMAWFAVDDDLRLPGFVIDALDAPLELQHHGTGGINEFYAALVGQGVGGGWLAVGAEQDACAAG